MSVVVVVVFVVVTPRPAARGLDTAVGPARQVLQLAAPAAERPPARLHRTEAAHGAHRPSLHPTHSTPRLRPAGRPAPADCHAWPGRTVHGRRCMGAHARPQGESGVLRRRRAEVAHVPRRDHEDDVLGDVGGVVADALEVARDQDQVERRLDGAAGPAPCRSAARGRSASCSASSSSSAASTASASAMSRRTKASSASRSMRWAMSAIRGMSMSGLTGGWRR